MRTLARRDGVCVPEAKFRRGCPEFPKIVSDGGRATPPSGDGPSYIVSKVWLCSASLDMEIRVGGGLGGSGWAIAWSAHVPLLS